MDQILEVVLLIQNFVEINIQDFKMDRFNYSRNEVDVRPWGKYEVLLDASNVKVKRITVNPNSRLSYQVDVREFYDAEDGKRLPTKKGITFTPKVLESVIEGLVQLQNNIEDNE